MSWHMCFNIYLTHILHSPGLEKAERNVEKANTLSPSILYKYFCVRLCTSQIYELSFTKLSHLGTTSHHHQYLGSYMMPFDGQLPGGINGDERPIDGRTLEMEIDVSLVKVLVARTVKSGCYLYIIINALV
jgi:hypothetical protein